MRRLLTLSIGAGLSLLPNAVISTCHMLLGQVMASQKQLDNKYKQAQTTADDWYRRAQLALQKVRRHRWQRTPLAYGCFP